MDTQAEKDREYTDQRIGEIRHQLSKHSDMISKLQDFQKDATKFQDRTRDHLDKVNKRIEAAGQQLHEDVQKASDKINAQIKELEANMTKQIEEANEKLQILGLKIKEEIKEKEETMNATI